MFALGLGSLVGGPLSETIGRYPIYVGTILLGSIFSIGTRFSYSIAVLYVLRFLARFCFAPSLAIVAGTINKVFRAEERALLSTIFILAPFLGPSLG